MPEGLEEGLLKNLRIHAFLKEKFDRKFKAIPTNIRSQFSFEMLRKQAESGNDQAFLSSMYALGFKKDKKYIWETKKEYKVIDQAEDYMNLLFDFDNTVHDILTVVLATPVDNQQYAKYVAKKGTWPAPKKEYQKTIKAFNKYIHYLSE